MSFPFSGRQCAGILKRTPDADTDRHLTLSLLATSKIAIMVEPSLIISCRRASHAHL